jgi:hypothetical protein
MHSFDGKNRPHLGGPGSDSGRVRTYFDKEGNRVSLSIHLLGNNDGGGWTPEWVQKEEPPKAAPVYDKSVTKAITDDVQAHRLECPICKHTESYKDGNRASWGAARGRISRHLRKETVEVSLHRELYTNEYGE